jgi:hypothetical protein
VICIDISFYGCCVKYTLRTLNDADEFDAINAAPKHIASSPFKCTPSSYFFKVCYNISYIFGTLIPPPTSSIKSI